MKYKLSSGNIPVNINISMPHLFGFYFAQEHGWMASGADIPRFGTPSEKIAWLESVGMNYSTMHIADKYGALVDGLPSDWKQNSSTREHIEAFEAANMYYGLFSWRTWSSLNRDMQIDYTHARDHFLELASRVSEIIGNNCIGYTTDHEYDSWGAVNGYTDPNGVSYAEAFNNDSSEFDLWLTDYFSGGFMSQLWLDHPNLFYGGAPNGAYWHPYKEGQPYIKTRQIYYNHQNTSSALLWGKITDMGHRSWSHIEDGAYQIGLSAGQFGDLAWHVGIDHTWDGKNEPDTRAGLRDWLLYAILDNPRLITITMTGGEFYKRNAPPCPICGYDSDHLSPEKKAFMKVFGDNLTSKNWFPAIAKWGDLSGQLQQGTAPIYTEEKPLVAYMMDAEPKLWVVNRSPDPVEVLTDWGIVSLDAYSFDTITQ